MTPDSDASEDAPPDSQAASSTHGSLRSRVSYNASARLAGRVGGALISLFALRLVTHHYGPSRWGEVVAAAALANFFVGVCDFGVMRIVSREMVRTRDGEAAIYGSGLLAGIAVSTGAMAVMAAADLAIYAAHPHLRSLTLVLVLSLPPNAIWLISSAVLVARARNDARGFIDVTSSAFLLAATEITLSAMLGVAGYLWMTVAADVATAALALGIARHYVRPTFRGSRLRVRKLLRQASPLGWSQALVNVAIQADVILLTLMASLATVGAFGVALQLAIFGASVPPMLTAAMLPKFVDGSPQRRQRLSQRAFDVLVSAGAILPVAALLFARSTMILLAGERFAGGTTALVLLSFYVAFLCPAAVFLDGLVYLQAEKTVLRVLLCGTVVTLVIAGSTIPFGAGTAAAVALASGSAVTALLGARTFRRVAGFSLRLHVGARSILIAAIMAGVYLAIHLGNGYSASRGWLMLPELTAVVVVYGLLCIAASYWRRSPRLG